MLSKRERGADGCEVVVVGGGIVGAAVAAQLSREGVDTAILEAQEVAGGATGRSVGMVLTGLSGHYNWAVSAYGRPEAREIWALTIGGQGRLAEAASGVGVPIEPTGSLSLAIDDAEADALNESAQLLRDDGFDVQFNAEDPLERGFHAALYRPDDFTVDAARLTQKLLSDSDVIVHEETEVQSLDLEGKDVRIWARGRNVRCGAVVLAVNGYAPLLHSYFEEKVMPVRSRVTATGPLSGVVLEQPFCADYGYEYCRQLADRRLVVGAWRRQDAQRKMELDEVIRDFTSRHFPDVDASNSEHRLGIMGLTPDGLPLLGTLPDLPQVFFAVGFGGRGLAWAFVVAERLVDAMLEGSDLGILSERRLEG